MPRSYSRLAQAAFDSRMRLIHPSRPGMFPIRILRKLVRKLAGSTLDRLARGHFVDVLAYGQTLRMPAEHHLLLLIKAYPRYNRPLALAVRAIAQSSEGRPVAIIDVGANIGETVSIIEESCPGVAAYLCVEADEEIAAICRFNHRDNARVETVQRFIGEEEGTAVQLVDDGRANSSTKMVEGEADNAANRLYRLDTVAAPFTNRYGSLALIKVDTEGYDFKVIRSGSGLLDRFSPALYFEWFPKLLKQLGEELWDGFDFLMERGYTHFVFFTSTGDYHCKLDSPDHFLLESLSALAEQNASLLYFDVFASRSEQLCRTLTRMSVAP